MSDKELAIKIRRLLLLIVSMLERHYKLGKYSLDMVQEISERDNITYETVI
jgi:hypothetical protein